VIDVIYNEDCLEGMKRIPSGSIQCCVTSPPYYGLRDYGVSGQLGLEKSPDEYVAKLVAVFHEVRRALRSDGTLWLNLGDSYAMSTKGSSGKGAIQRGNRGTLLADRRWSVPSGLKPKDLIGIPWRVAFALQADGWYLRQDIIWHKPNPMPESVRDRCTKAHEYVFLLSKSPRYFYDAEAVKEPVVNGEKFHGAYSDLSILNITTKRRNGRLDNDNRTEKRNKRSVWTITPQPYRGAHFAVMPEALIEPCILAGSKPDDVVLDPFSGAGTVALVASRNQRHYLGFELNAEYCRLAQERLDHATAKAQPTHKQSKAVAASVPAQNYGLFSQAWSAGGAE
jgi:DNA modification methylase